MKDCGHLASDCLMESYAITLCACYMCSHCLSCCDYCNLCETL